MALAERPSVSRMTAPDRLAAMLRAEPQRLRRRSISLGVPVSDADDAAQNAALRAWRSVDALRSSDSGSVCSWLDTIVRTTAIDMHRARKDDLGEVLCDRLESGQDVAREVELQEQLTAAFQAIASLPPTLREPLLLFVIDGRSAGDIAKELGLSAATVRQRIARARRALRG